MLTPTTRLVPLSGSPCVAKSKHSLCMKASPQPLPDARTRSTASARDSNTSPCCTKRVRYVHSTSTFCPHRRRRVPWVVSAQPRTSSCQLVRCWIALSRSTPAQVSCVESDPSSTSLGKYSPTQRVSSCKHRPSVHEVRELQNSRFLAEAPLHVIPVALESAHAIPGLLILDARDQGIMCLDGCRVLRQITTVGFPHSVSPPSDLLELIFARGSSFTAIGRLGPSRSSYRQRMQTKTR